MNAGGYKRLRGAAVVMACMPVALVACLVVDVPAGGETALNASSRNAPVMIDKDAVGETAIGCDDFADWRQAQAFFLNAGGPRHDEHGLDTDDDGIACNTQSDEGIGSQAYSAPRLPINAGPLISLETEPREYTAADIGALPWDDFEREGYPFVYAKPGDAITMLTGIGKSRDMRCSDEIGSSFDAELNPTWSEFSHFIWLWYEDGSERGCIAVSKWENWHNKIPGRRHVGYERPAPAQTAAYGEPVRLPVAGSEVQCGERSMLFAAWSEERGLVGIDDSDMAIALGAPIEDRDDLAVFAARLDGWYLVYADGYPPDGEGVCMRFPTLAAIEVEPCLRCHVGLLEAQDD